MKLPQAVFLVLSLALPLFANASDRLSNNEITAILQGDSVSIRVLGMLKFCGMSDLENTVLKDITGPHIRDFISSDINSSREKSQQVVHAIDIQTVGIAMGLSLARMLPEDKDSFCSLAVDVANELRSQEGSPAET